MNKILMKTKYITDLCLYFATSPNYYEFEIFVRWLVNWFEIFVRSLLSQKRKSQYSSLL